MKLLILMSLILTMGSAFAKDCSQSAYRAARAVDSISNGTSTSQYKLQATRTLKSIRSGGDTLDTIEVSMVIDEDMSAVWQVDVYRADCVIKAVRFVTGD